MVCSVTGESLWCSVMTKSKHKGLIYKLYITSKHQTDQKVKEAGRKHQFGL